VGRKTCAGRPPAAPRDARGRTGASASSGPGSASRAPPMGHARLVTTPPGKRAAAGAASARPAACALRPPPAQPAPPSPAPPFTPQAGALKPFHRPSGQRGGGGPAFRARGCGAPARAMVRRRGTRRPHPLAPPLSSTLSYRLGRRLRERHADEQQDGPHAERRHGARGRGGGARPGGGGWRRGRLRRSDGRSGAGGGAERAAREWVGRGRALRWLAALWRKTGSPEARRGAAAASSPARRSHRFARAPGGRSARRRPPGARPAFVALYSLTAPRAAPAQTPAAPPCDWRSASSPQTWAAPAPRRARRATRRTAAPPRGGGRPPACPPRPRRGRG